MAQVTSTRWADMPVPTFSAEQKKSTGNRAAEVAAILAQVKILEQQAAAKEAEEERLREAQATAAAEKRQKARSANAWTVVGQNGRPIDPSAPKKKRNKPKKAKKVGKVGMVIEEKSSEVKK